MSENELIRNSNNNIEEQDAHNTILGVYQAESIDTVKIQDKLRKIYAPIQRFNCTNYESPDLAPINQRKRVLGKKFAAQAQKSENKQYDLVDGVYEFSKNTDANDEGIIRQKIRLVNDVRQAFWQENSTFIIQKDLFSSQLSKLANISYETNSCIQTFQKNAILSQRNNQKKQIPYQIDFFIGGLWFSNHPLQNQQEKKFQEIRVLLKQWAQIAAHPALPQLSQEINFLQKLREDGQRQQQIEKKLQHLNAEYAEMKADIQNLMKTIIRGHEQLKSIRKTTGMETVPWKIVVKQYQLQGKNSFDIGVNSFEVSDRVVGGNADDIEKQQKRREEIKDQRYYLRVYANNFQIGRSQKVHLQWPSYKATINQKFTIMVFTAPSSLKIQVIKCGLIDTIIDTIYVSVPGMNARSLTASQSRIGQTKFSSHRNSQQDGKQDDKDSKIKRKGMLLHKLQWVGEGNKMPTMATKTTQEQTQSTQMTEASIDDKKQYQQLFDILDPRKPHLGNREKVQRELKQAGNALMPFVDVISTRHLLLKLKNVLPQMQKVQVPLKQEDILMRQDLLQIIDQQAQRYQAKQTFNQTFFHPLQGIFAKQNDQVLMDIRNTINKLDILKSLSSGTGGGNIRYKVTQEIVDQFIFEQMESPLVIFFKNLFTQKRKLGPQVSKRIKAKTKVDQLQINLHVRSARNVPIRQTSFQRIRRFQQQQNRFKMQQMQLGMNNFQNTGMMDRFGGYAQGFFRQQPNVNMHGNTFFNAMQNQGARNAQISYDHLNLDRVCTLIQLRFKKNIKRTRTFQGPFPQWNQTLMFNYSMKHEQTSLEKILLGGQTGLKVFIFDMSQESKPTQAISEARVKKSKFYLGRIDVPFVYLMAVPSCSGLYKIDRPLIVFGYGIRRVSLFDVQNEEEQSKTINPDVHSYLNLDLFSQPTIDNMIAYNSDRKFVPSAGENPLVLQRASDWLDELNTKRYIRLWLSNIQGKSVFICRFLSDSICPPKLVGESGNDNMIEHCARFVSLIPRKQNCKLLEGTQEFHFQCDQFLNMKMGEDHGILLCNYFNYIDKAQGRRELESSLLICKAFPYGKCIFVLRRDKVNKHAEIWDPFTGQCYYQPIKQYDTFCCCILYEKQPENIQVRGKDICPIIQVSCVVTRENVFFNTQESVKPPTVDFDLQNEKLWRPFLTQRSRNDLFETGKSIQTIQNAINPNFYQDIKGLKNQLEVTLKRAIQQKLSSERINHIRPYTFKSNVRIADMIKNKLLPLCQRFRVAYRISGSEAATQMYSQRMKMEYEQALNRLQQERDKIKDEVQHPKNLFGFTLNMTYTTVEDIIQKITDTQIHLEESEDIDFVIAVDCCQYPCHLVSVWVFLGIIG